MNKIPMIKIYSINMVVHTGNYMHLTYKGFKVQPDTIKSVCAQEVYCEYEDSIKPCNRRLRDTFYEVLSCTEINQNAYIRGMAYYIKKEDYERYFE